MFQNVDHIQNIDFREDWRVLVALLMLFGRSRWKTFSDYLGSIEVGILILICDWVRPVFWGGLWALLSRWRVYLWGERCLFQFILLSHSWWTHRASFPINLNRSTALTPKNLTYAIHSCLHSHRPPLLYFLWRSALSALNLCEEEIVFSLKNVHVLLSLFVLAVQIIIRSH
jgi:hypothetical protein